jgi:hypothetical protein
MKVSFLLGGQNQIELQCGCNQGQHWAEYYDNSRRRRQEVSAEKAAFDTASIGKLRTIFFANSPQPFQSAVFA